MTLVLLEIFAQGFAERDGFRGDDVDERAALHAWKEFAIDFDGVFFFAENQSAARAAQSFVRGRRDVIGVRHG